MLKRTQQQTAENQQNNQSILYRIPERMSINLSVNQMLILSIPITILHVVYQLDSWQLEGFLNEEKPAYQKVFILPTQESTISTCRAVSGEGLPLSSARCAAFGWGN